MLSGAYIQNRVELIVNQMNLKQSRAVQRQVKPTIHHSELPQTLSTLLFFLFFSFSASFPPVTQSVPLCLVLETQHECVWPRTVRMELFVFVCVATWSLHTSLAVPLLVTTENVCQCVSAVPFPDLRK